MVLLAIALVLAFGHDTVLPASPIAQATLLIAICVVLDS
jgi:hypothetical protein